MAPAAGGRLAARRKDRAETLADAAVQLRRLEAIDDTGAMLELDWRGLTRLVGSIRGAVEQRGRSEPDIFPGDPPDLVPHLAGVVTVGGSSDSTASSNFFSGTLAIREAVFADELLSRSHWLPRLRTSGEYSS